MAEFTEKIIVKEENSSEVEYACGLCGDFLNGPGETECYMCGAYIDPNATDRVMTKEEHENEFV